MLVSRLSSGIKPTPTNKRVTISSAVCALFSVQPLMVFTMWSLNKKQAKVLMQRYLMFKPTDMELTEPVG